MSANSLILLNYIASYMFGYFRPNTDILFLLPVIYNALNGKRKKGIEIIFHMYCLGKIMMKCRRMMLDFGKMKNGTSYFFIFHNSITSHSKLCIFVRHFDYLIGRSRLCYAGSNDRAFWPSGE